MANESFTRYTSISIFCFTILLTFTFIGQTTFLSADAQESSSNQNRTIFTKKTFDTINQSVINSEATNNTRDLIFVHYKKTGGFAGINYNILYDSITHQMQVINNGDMKTTYLSVQQESNIKQIFLDSKFFKSKIIYNPTVGADYFEYLLNVTIGNKSHAVYWTDISPNTPLELFEIAQKLEEIAG